jgi:DNA primase large subunit
MMNNMLVSITDFAKYPFLKEAANYIKSLDLQINELISQEYIEVISRAEQRIEEALLKGEVEWKRKPSYEIEVLSYPVAVMLVVVIDDDFLSRRYALAEAKRSHKILRDEDRKKLLQIAKSTFNWEGSELSSETQIPYDYSLHFIHYLKNASKFRSVNWKLVNRSLENGNVYLKKEELARLLSEEVQKHIYNTIKSSPKVVLPPSYVQRIERINEILNERKEKVKRKTLPKRTITAAYPPCIKRLYDALLLGHHLSHSGRFTLTSFLLNVGVSVEELIQIYTSVSDFDQRLTRYQIEHIAGAKGSRIKYTSPSCNTLQTHGLCPGPDQTCKKIRHPLSYYRIKIGSIRNSGVTNNERTRSRLRREKIQ